MIEPELSDEYRAHYARHADTIAERLAEFKAVPSEEYLWELLYCLLTPQSRALHAEQVIAKLRKDDFLHAKFDPTAYLRDPAHYIRFHNQKAQRLLDVAGREEEIRSLL